MIMTDFLKFCRDFEIPCSKEDQTEAYRLLVKKNKLKKVDYETFNEILKELFFVINTEQQIREAQKEVDEIYSQGEISELNKICV
jgi:hypothetical protein